MSPSPENRPRRLSEDISHILEIIAERPMTIGDLMWVMKGRGYNLLLIFLSLPFCLPIPLPGLSTVLGTIIAFIGLRLSMGQEPILPKRMLDTKLSPTLLQKVLQTARRLAVSFEYLLKPRLSFLVEWPILHRMNGVMIMISGALLLLPLPIPASNLLPALTIIALAAAMLERDGVFVIIGFLAFLGNVVFFGAIFIGSKALVTQLIDYLNTWRDYAPGD